jgi:hypothetical protein
LRGNGLFVLDYLNADHVRTSLVAEDSRKVGNRMVTQHRRITADGRYVEKEISAQGYTRPFEERVRLFEPGDLRCLLHDAGLAIAHEMGDYNGGPLTLESPRAIFFARRS